MPAVNPLGEQVDPQVATVTPVADAHPQNCDGAGVAVMPVYVVALRMAFDMFDM